MFSARPLTAMVTTVSARRLASTLTAPQVTQQPSRPLPSSSQQPHRSRSRRRLPSPLDDEVPYQPVFNILGAPSRPNEPRLFLKKSVKLPKTYSCADRQRLAKERIRDPMPPKRLTMPSPRVFDGPAQPRHAALQESQRRRPSLAPQQLQTEPWATMPSTPITSSAKGRPLSTSAPNGQAIPSSSVVKIFDGPARLSRYHHKSQEEKESYWRRRKNTTTLVMLAGGSAAFVGYAVTSWS